MLKKPSPPLRTSEGTGARSNVGNAHAFAKRLADVFQPHPSENEPEEEEVLTHFWRLPTKSMRQSNATNVPKFKKTLAV
jgi:hypothetical protein